MFGHTAFHRSSVFQAMDFRFSGNENVPGPHYLQRFVGASFFSIMPIIDESLGLLEESMGVLAAGQLGS